MPIPASAVAPESRARTARASTFMRRLLAAHAAFLAIVGGYLVVTRLSGRPFVVLVPIWSVLLWALPLVLLFEVTRLRWQYRSKRRPGGPLEDREAWRRVGSGLLSGVLSPFRLASGLLVLCLVSVFMNAFIAWKQSIPAFRAYDWDPLFAELDRWMHLGIDPWRLTHAALGSPLATRAVDVLYTSWYAVVIFTVIGFAFAPSSRLRARFLSSYVLVWVVLGTVMAAAFASGGPVYYANFTGEPRFEPLMTQLGALDLRATQIQAALWAGFTGESDFLAEGIAAMPSVHVGIAVLFALVAWRAGAWVRWTATAYAGAILLGSVHLGWHYAADGYVAAGVTWILWAAMGRLHGDRAPGPDPPVARAG